MPKDIAAGGMFYWSANSIRWPVDPHTFRIPTLKDHGGFIKALDEPTSDTCASKRS